MRIALIGATGFVGSHILDEALDRKHEVTAIVRRTERLPVHGGLIAKKGDVLDVDELAGFLAGHEAVIASYNADKDSPDVYEAMIAGAKAIIAAYLVRCE